ncbi:MAG: alpha-glucuronidase [Candidatus Symbiothrix sp.]|jgi:alpha-glucuronidase|nr:alpha-glucuronidase [Candidatus Symbiothrix sp.]
MKKMAIIVLLLYLFIPQISAEDGSRLWLQNKSKGTETLSIAKQELKQSWKGKAVEFQLINDFENDAFKIIGNAKKIKIIASSDIALLYGVYHLLGLQQTGKITNDLNINEYPHCQYRILNHWDNLDGSIERGYAGKSLWKWDELPHKISPRYAEYARANASIGINGTVLNNVNASPQILQTEMLQKVKALADVFRPYGIKVYLSVNFSSPAIIGNLKTSDPLDKEVQQWWKNKTDEIYRLIPDFGGFLVKANSEGQPGPQDFGRTHADGANLLADALRPHNGIVMWRAFVYASNGDDRAKQAYTEFTPLDGRFRDNVILQIKNGPIDFQPREPYHPLFGAMPQTAVMPEFQITQEYLGSSNHLVFLATMWREFFESVNFQSFKAIAGVANTGNDTNWCGHPFSQANWYAFGRLAWNPRLLPETIADEWLRMTFSNDSAFVDPVKTMMLDSWETAVNYMTPLGLHHLFAYDHHYGPEPWCDVPDARADWLPKYYHRADNQGIGFDRTSNGSDAVSQYPSPLREKWNHPSDCPEKYLLWFHHLPWDYPMKSGRILWDELCYKYDGSVKQVREFQGIWDKQESRVDAERFRLVQSKLEIQAHDAVWWKDACLLYFQTFSQLPISSGNF